MMVMSDTRIDYGTQEWWTTSDAVQLGGHGHPVYFTAKKASRVSHSTSHAETNACVGCHQVAQLISSRFTELFCEAIVGSPATPKRLLNLHEGN